MTYKKQFKKSFSYTWYLYLLGIVVPCVIFPLSYSFMHRPKQFETLSVFLACSLKNEKAEVLLLEKFKNLGVRKFEFVTSDPAREVEFAKKISVVGYNRCDLIIIPEDKLDKVGVFTTSIDLNDEIKNLCNITSENLFKQDDKDYAVELPKNGGLSEYANFIDDTNYYAFINAKSYNIGDYSQFKPNTKNAFELMRFCLEK